MTAQVWLTSDLHVGHRFVAGLRGFATAPEHDEAIAANWETVVKSDDQVWVLGDVALGHFTTSMALLQDLPGHKHLIVGNHDKCHPMFRDSHKWQSRYLEVFESVQAFARRRIDGTEVLLSHFPYEADRGLDPRYMQYRLRDEGLALLHGHTHGKERLHDGREIHVGVDAWDLAPVSLDQVAALLREALIDSAPHQD